MLVRDFMPFNKIYNPRNIYFPLSELAMNEIHSSVPLISVVVPVYRVEEYLAQCLESICRQTHSSLEIIVVDDGSPDNSGKIADEFSKRDARIKVIHTENKGVSAARNLGIDNSDGEYIAFVDSDDRLASDFLEYMLRVVKETGAYFAMSKNCYKSPNEPQVEKDEIETYSPERAASELLYPYIEIGCWNKLFRRDFLEKNNIRFPVDFHMGEGLNFIVNAAQLSNCVGVGSKKVYHYRKDNINSATTKVSVEKFINALAAIDNIRRNSILNSPEFTAALGFHKYLTTFWALNTIIRTGARKSYSIEYKQWTRCIKRDAFSMMKARVAPSMKFKILLYSISPTYILSARYVLGILKRRMLAK